MRSSIDKYPTLEITYFTYDDSLPQHIYDISGGEPTVLKLCAYSPINIIEDTYLLQLLKIKELFGETIYNVFIDHKGLVSQNELKKLDGFNDILHSNYIHIYQTPDKKIMISLKPVICYVIRRSAKY